MLNKQNFKQLLYETYNGKIEAIDEYVNANTEIRFYCHEKDSEGNEHGEFVKTPYEVVTLKRPCKKCLGTYDHKPNGYWNNKENCIEEAKKYRNKYELQLKCIGCYNGFFRNKWFDELNEVYKDSIIIYSNPEDKIHCIYVYDLKDFNTCYVGRTKDVERRDRQHRNGYGHSDGTREFDNLWKFCDKNGIEMPSPIILESNLNAEESQIKENEWLQKYINDGYKPLNVAPTGKNLSSLGARLKWTYEACKEEAKKYKNKNEMKIKNQSAYNSCVKNKWINEFFTTTKKPTGYWDIFENAQKEASKCKDVKDFMHKWSYGFNAAIKNGFLKDLKYNNEENN